MTDLPPAARRLLAQTNARWRQLLFLRRSARLAAVVCGFILLLGIGMMTGWLTSAVWVTIGIVVICVLGILVWLGMAVVTLAGLDSDDRDLDLAAAVEQSHRPLMDRLNTLVFLRHTRDRQLRAYADRIGGQTKQVLADEPPVLPFAPRAAMGDAAVLGIVLLATALFYGYFHPWHHLVSVKPEENLAASSDTSWEIPPFAEEQPQANQEQPWCDVRISEPGRDLRVTAIDRIPLRIEAASNQPLTTIEWFTSVNGSDETQHRLPPIENPSYVVYQPDLSIPDLDAKPWDVVRYYARATTRDGKTYSSAMYFAEVAPFREDLEHFRNSQENTQWSDLEQLSSLIDRHKEVLRQTHQEAQSPSGQPEKQKGRLEQLAQKEAELQKEASHLAADLANRKQETNTDSDASMRRAAESLERAEDALLDTELPLAIQSEEAALRELTAARNELLESAQRDVARVARQNAPPAETPDPFESSAPPESTRSDQTLLEDQLQAAREFVQQTLLAQRNLERQADPRGMDQFPKLAEDQERLNESMNDYLQKNPSSFAECQTDCANAQSAMKRTAQSLAGANAVARQDAGRAADALQQLDDSLEKQQLWNRLAEAHQLRKAIEQQISQLEQCPQGGFQPGQAKQLTQQAQDATRRMKTIAENAPSREYFEDALREALSDEKVQEMTGQCDRLGQAGSSGEQRQAADQLAQQLRQIAEGFDASCSNSVAKGENRNGLTPNGQEALAQGIRQLQSAAQNADRNRALSQHERVQLAKEGGTNLAAGISSLYGDNPRAEQVLDDLQHQLEQPESLIDPEVVQQLLAAIQRIRREGATGAELDGEPSDRRTIDPTRFAPAYRQAIEKYFEKLSEE